jgi:hypothetical protein
MTFCNGAAVPEADRTIVALQVPPQSRSMFTRYQIQEGFKIRGGVIAASDLVTCTQEKVVNGTKKYANIKFSRG